MNKIRAIFISVIFLSVLSYGQNDNGYNTEIELDIKIDESVYTISQGNSYYTSDESSVMEFLSIPKTYEEMREILYEKKQSSDSTFMEEISLSNVKMLLIKQSSLKDSEHFTIAIYCKKLNENATLVVNSFYETNQEEYFKSLIEKAILSAKLKE